MEPPNMLLQKHDDGLYRLDTESSHVDMNVPGKTRIQIQK